MAQNACLPGMARDIPFNVLKDISILLNASRKNDYRMLAGFTGCNIEQIKTFGLADNPTEAFLLHWGTGIDSTTRKLEEYLVQINRHDVIDVLYGRAKCGKDKKYVKLEAMETDAPDHLVREIDYITRHDICVKLNLPDVVGGNDYRTFAAKVGVSGPQLKEVSRQDNPTDVILSAWGPKQGATVEKMREIMREMGREDVVDILDEYLQSLKY